MRVVWWWVLGGCAVEPEEVDSGACGSWDDVRVVTITYCDACHAETTRDRHEAPVDVTFDTEADAARWAERMAERVLAGEMPPGGGLSESERAVIEAWAGCAEP